MALAAPTGFEATEASLGRKQPLIRRSNSNISTANLWSVRAA
jgi:hypothetical protein